MKRLTSLFLGVILCLTLSSCVSYGPGPAPLSRDQVPWDYRLIKGTVGEIVGNDLVVLPDNIVIERDDYYTIGDKVWVLQYMEAEFSTYSQDRTEMKLSSWKSLRPYIDKERAIREFADLKEIIQTELDLIGVYKTEYQGKFRQFAVFTMPTGNVIKQPISNARYELLKNQTKVKVNIEQIHDYFKNPDNVYAKFRGWAE